LSDPVYQRLVTQLARRCGIASEYLLRKSTWTRAERDDVVILLREVEKFLVDGPALASPPPDEPPPQDYVIKREVVALRQRISWLEGTAMPHARRQENANGFQKGWHAALARISEGVETVDDLAVMVPYPAANSDDTLRFAPPDEPPHWRPITTLPDEVMRDGTVVLRPHVIYGAMDVRWKPGIYCGKHYNWINGDYTTSWPDEAFADYWMPLPAPPDDPEAHPREDDGRTK
jgi:hypothetical protein